MLNSTWHTVNLMLQITERIWSPEIHDAPLLISDSRSQFWSSDLGASDDVGLLSACDYNPHSNHTLQVCEHCNTTAHSTQELIPGLKASPQLREVSVGRITYIDLALHSAESFIFNSYSRPRDIYTFWTKYQLFA